MHRIDGRGKVISCLAAIRSFPPSLQKYPRICLQFFALLRLVERDSIIPSRDRAIHLPYYITTPSEPIRLFDWIEFEFSAR